MAKFKVGDMVRFIYSKRTRFHIASVLEETCCAGTQVHYIGRTYYKDMFEKNPMVAKEMIKISEIEVEAVPTATPDVAKLITKLTKEKDVMKMKKEDAVKNQSFEKAAEYREKERELSLKIETLKGDE